MSLGFSLIGDSSLWLTTSVGSWGINHRWVEGYSTPQEFSGVWEPYGSGEDNLVLPAGVSSSDSLILFTKFELKTHNDLQGNMAVADLIYLKDPNTFPDAAAYVCWSKAPYVELTGFSLITESFGEYLLVRREKKE